MKPRSFFYIFLILGLKMSCGANLSAQSNLQMEQAAKSALAAKGIPEEEFQKKLEDRGIRMSDLESMSAEEAAGMRNTFEEIIAEIEAEHSVKNKRNNFPSALEKKSNTVQQGKEGTMVVSDTIPKHKVSAKDSLIPLTMQQSVPAIWGQQFFLNQQFKLVESSGSSNPPLSYILGSGDRLTISIWGMSQYNESFVINDEGYIQPARMPRIFLKGISLQKAKGMVKNFFRKYYRFEDQQFELALQQTRAINVNIFGEVNQPGGYTISAMNTAFNALAAAGGLTNLASVRKIKVIRKNKTTLLDVYKFIRLPVVEPDFYLEQNDIIQVGVADKTVSIEGAIGRPHVYELLDSEHLNQLIVYAGGLKEDAIVKTIQVERTQNDRKVILDVPYLQIREKNGDFQLKRGDKVRVNFIRTQAENFIYVNGAVRADVKYQYVEGMKLSELIMKLDFIPETNYEIAFIKRLNADGTYTLLRVNLQRLLSGDLSGDVQLNGGDELMVFKNSSFVDQAYVHVVGAVRVEGLYQFNPNADTRVKDLLLLSGGLKADAFPNALLFRKHPNNSKELEILRINVQEVMAADQSDQNIFLRPFDSLVIQSISSFDQSEYVEISGAVKNPGRYPFGKGMLVEDLIQLANGFTYSAASNRIEVFRMQMKDGLPSKVTVQSVSLDPTLKNSDNSTSFVLSPFDIVIVRNQPGFQFQQMVHIGGEVRFPGPYALIAPNERLSDVVQRAGGLTAEAFAAGATLYRSSDSIGYVVIDLNEALMRVKSHANIILKESDYIYIPKQKDLVRIAGATNAQDLYPEKMLSNNNTISVAYQDGKSAKFYIDHYAAGISNSGDADKVTVEHANGRIDRTKQFLFFKVYPKVTHGAVIHVGYKDIKPEKAKKEKKDVDWAKVVADSIAQATAILSLILLIDRLN